MAGNILMVTDETFDAEVLQSAVPVLVDFTATWCGPCKALAPIVETIASEAAGKYKIVKVDIDEAPDTAAKFKIRGVPTCLVFEAGQVKAQHVGLTNKEGLLKLLA